MLRSDLGNVLKLDEISRELHLSKFQFIRLFKSHTGITPYQYFFHRNDVGWLNIYREGVSSIQRSLESLDRVSTLRISQAYSGHGPQIDDPLRSIDTARRRLEKWLRNPEKVSWHACNRIFSFTLIMKNGLPKKEIDSYLLNCGWFQDFSRYAFQLQPEEFIQILLDEMIRSGAANWHNNYLIATAPYTTPQKEWMDKNIKPKNWHDMIFTQHE